MRRARTTHDHDRGQDGDTGDGRRPSVGRRRAAATRGRSGEEEEARQAGHQRAAPQQFPSADPGAAAHVPQDQREDQSTDEQRLHQRQGAVVQRHDLETDSDHVAAEAGEPQRATESSEPCASTARPGGAVRSGLLQRRGHRRGEGRGESQPDDEPIHGSPSSPARVPRPTRELASPGRRTAQDPNPDAGADSCACRETSRCSSHCVEPSTAAGRSLWRCTGSTPPWAPGWRSTRPDRGRAEGLPRGASLRRRRGGACRPVDWARGRLRDASLAASARAVPVGPVARASPGRRGLRELVHALHESRPRSGTRSGRGTTPRGCDVRHRHSPDRTAWPAAARPIRYTAAGMDASAKLRVPRQHRAASSCSAS